MRPAPGRGGGRRLPAGGGSLKWPGMASALQESVCGKEEPQVSSRRDRGWPSGGRAVGQWAGGLERLR